MRPVYNIPLFEQSAKEWLRLKQKSEAEGDIGDKHLSCIKMHIELFLKLKTQNGVIAKQKTDNLKYDDWEKVIVPALSVGRKRQTGRSYLTTLRSFCKWCCAKEYMRNNLAKQFVIPLGEEVYESRDLRVITPQEIREVINHAKGAYKLRISFAAYTGVRGQEQWPMKWDAIDFDKGWVTIDTALKSASRPILRTVGKPKSKQGQRHVPLPMHVLNMLKQWKMQQPIVQRQFGYVFPTSVGTREMDGNNWNKRGLAPACVAAGVERMTWKDLRNFYASCLIFNEEMRDAEVAQFLGHHSINFTYQRYARYYEMSTASTKHVAHLDKVFGLAAQPLEVTG